jgi:uncharacterized protein (DUF697 family)
MFILAASTEEGLCFTQVVGHLIAVRIGQSTCHVVSRFVMHVVTLSGSIVVTTSGPPTVTR